MRIPIAIIGIMIARGAFCVVSCFDGIVVIKEIGEFDVTGNAIEVLSERVNTASALQVVFGSAGKT